MAFFGIFSLNRKTFFNPTGWLGLDNMKTMNANLIATVKPLYQKQVPSRVETFAQAMERLGLTEQDVQLGSTSYRTYAFGFLLLGFAGLAYAFYLLLSHGSIYGLILGFVTSILFFTQAFKYDFWAMQMRQRRLGITVSEWSHNILGSKKGSS
jgi:hypothetical protein